MTTDEQKTKLTELRKTLLDLAETIAKPVAENAPSAVKAEALQVQILLESAAKMARSASATLEDLA